MRVVPLLLGLLLFASCGSSNVTTATPASPPDTGEGSAAEDCSAIEEELAFIEKADDSADSWEEVQKLQQIMADRARLLREGKALSCVFPDRRAIEEATSAADDGSSEPAPQDQTLGPLLLEYGRGDVDPSGLSFQLVRSREFGGGLDEPVDDAADGAAGPPGYDYEAHWLYGNMELEDPFSEGDLLLRAGFDPHDDDYHVVDWSSGREREIKIDGRTALIRTWTTDFDREVGVGFEVFWDASPEHYVYAATRTFSERELVAILQTVSFPVGGPRFDHEAFGVQPLPMDSELVEFADPKKFDLKQGFHAKFQVWVGDGSNADLDFWVVNGDGKDVLMWRFMAAAEQLVNVGGKRGYLLDGIGDAITMLVWEEGSGTIGILVSRQGFRSDLLPGIAARLDPTLIPLQ